MNIEGISATGTIKVNFNTNMRVPDDLTVFGGQQRNLESFKSALEVFVLVDDDELEREFGGLKWGVTRYLGNQLWLQLDFEKPESISTERVYDSLCLKVVDKELFQSLEGLIISEQELTHQLPP